MFTEPTTITMHKGVRLKMAEQFGEYLLDKAGHTDSQTDMVIPAYPTPIHTPNFVRGGWRCS